MDDVEMTNCCNHTGITDQYFNNPLSIMLQTLVWNTLVVISDDYFPLTSMDFSNKLELYMINSSDTSHIDNVLNDHVNPKSPNNLFIIICAPTGIMNILQQINAHEHNHQEQGVLTYLHRWLVVADNHTDFGQLELNAHNITNLSVMIKGANKTDLVYSVNWEPHGRALHLSARVRNGNVSGEVFPNAKYGLNGRPLIIATNSWGPFVTRTLQPDGSYHYVGLCVEILKAVAQRMNFTYRWELPQDGQWGEFFNGSWTGLVKQMHDKTADMMSAPLSIQVNRAAVMDFSFPFYIEETAIIYRQPSSASGATFLFIKPYRIEVWLCMVAVVPFMGIVVWILSHFRDGSFNFRFNNDFRSLQKGLPDGKDGMKMERLAEGEKSLVDSIWMTFGEAFAQGADKISSSTVVRVVLIVWVLMCVVYAATFSSNLVALLTVETEYTPFSTLEELAVHGTFRYSIQGGTLYPDVFKRAHGVYGTMWRRMLEWQEQGIPVLSSKFSVHMELVDAGNLAHLGDGTALKIKASTDCNMRLYTNNLFPLEYAMGFQNNSAYETEASSIIMQLSQTGLLSKWQRQFWPSQSNCYTQNNAGRPTTLNDLSGLFYIVIGCLSFTCFIFGFEKVRWKRDTQARRIKVSPAESNDNVKGHGLDLNRNQKGMSTPRMIQVTPVR